MYQMVKIVQGIQTRQLVGTVLPFLSFQGGQASKEEMCLDFLLYYPKQDNFKTCQSTANAQPFYQKYAKNGNK